MFRHSWTQALFGGEPLEHSLARLSRFGYAGVELPVLPQPSEEIRALLGRHRLACFSVNGSFIGADRDLSSADEALRSAAVDYVGSTMRFAASLGAAVVIIVPTRIGKLQPDVPLAAEWDTLVGSLRRIGEVGRQLGVAAVIECVNRSETYLANRLDTARRLVEAAGSEHVMLMADSFHMNIEETDSVAALEGVAPYLRHVHLADNNRMAPGMGQMNLDALMATLIRIGFDGPLTMECDVQAVDAYGRYAPSRSPEVFDAFAGQAIDHLRAMERRLR